MPKFLDTRGRSTLGIGICGRCSRKMSLDDLYPDPNYPGLYVCSDDLDRLDPWRLAARETESIVLDHPRPDTPIDSYGVTPLYGQQVITPVIDGVAQDPIAALGPVRVWQPDTYFEKRETITPQNIDDEAVQLPQTWLICIRSGWSGSTPPDFPKKTGVVFKETLP